MEIIRKFRWPLMIAACLVAAAGCSKSTFSSSVKTAPYPWTHTNFPETGEDFHFAVVSDRNGGCRPGVFEAAVKDLNLLRPAFVMSIGDLIGGYTSDANAVRDQWTEFDGVVKELESPFFYVPGNHDYGIFSQGVNQAALNNTANAWFNLRGPTHYWFTYRNTLFLCLNSMGGENHRTGLGEEQLEWAKDVLMKHPKVRWTFVFMHIPLWVLPEELEPGMSKKPLRFPELEKALAGRNYTMFAGHLHNYVFYNRHGMKYFVLATTGGESKLSGPQWGQFDHVLWVSMTDSGPRFANLSLDGILPEDICTEAANNFCYSAKLTAKETTGQKKGSDFSLSFENFFNVPLNFTVKWKNNPYWSFQPEEKSDTVSPGAKYSASFHANFHGESWPSQPTLACRFEAGTQFKVNHDLTLPDADADYLDFLWPKTTIEAFWADRVPTIDGKLDDPAWQRPPTVNGFMRPDASGKAVPKTQTWIAYDNENLYVAWRCAEKDINSIIATVKDRDGQVYLDDSVELFLDTKLDHQHYYQFTINTLGTVYDAFGQDSLVFNFKGRTAVSRDNEGWTVELALPWEDMKVQPPKAGARIGFELVRDRPRTRISMDMENISQFPPLGTPNNLHPKLFGELVFGK